MKLKSWHSMRSARWPIRKQARNWNKEQIVQEPLRPSISTRHSWGSRGKHVACTAKRETSHLGYQQWICHKRTHKSLVLEESMRLWRTVASTTQAISARSTRTPQWASFPILRWPTIISRISQDSQYSRRSNSLRNMNRKNRFVLAGRHSLSQMWKPTQALVSALMVYCVLLTNQEYKDILQTKCEINWRSNSR